MGTVTQDFGEGGAGLSPGGGAGKPTLTDHLRDAADDLETLRVQFNALLAKLDADAGVTDTNFVSTLQIQPATVKLKKG